MNYFTPTQERIAIVETASYNQKLLALRARRLAQQRMDFAHKIASMNEEYYTNQNDETNEMYLGSPPQITEQSDDEYYEMDEIFAPVPYQKGYWIAAQKAQQEKKKKEKKIQQQKQQKQQNTNTNTNNKNNVKPQTNIQTNTKQATTTTQPQRIHRPVSSNTHNTNNPTRSQYQYPYSNSTNRPHAVQYPYKPYTAPRGPAHNKKPQYRPATQYHPSYQRNKKPNNGPPGLM